MGWARAVLAIGALAGCGRFGFDSIPATEPPDASVGPDAFQLPLVGSWEATPTSPLAPRVWTSAVWTGTEFVVFGGATDASYDPTDTGAAYNPSTHTWRSLSVTGAPSARHTTRMAVVGTTIIEYGGGVGFGPTDGGGTYDTVADSWFPMSSADPGARIYASIVEANGLVATWGGWGGGPHLDTGFIYDPTLDTWKAMTEVGAPSARSFASMIWTGDRLIVWGGCDGGLPDCAGVKNDGAAYNPKLDLWTPISSAGAPSPRSEHGAVWTGSEMIVFGGASQGLDGGPLADGGIYTPATDTWRPLAPGPTGRADPGAAWMGDRMAVWGSSNGKTDGFLYDPATDSWDEMATTSRPSPRSRFAFAASNTQVFVWGGSFTDPSGAVWTR